MYIHVLFLPIFLSQVARDGCVVMFSFFLFLLCSCSALCMQLFTYLWCLFHFVFPLIPPGSDVVELLVQSPAVLTEIRGTHLARETL